MGKARILLIDDEKELVEIVSSQLEIAGYDVNVAYSGLEGLKKVSEDIPNLIILDIIMPVMDGFEVLRRLKRDPKTSKVPVIMLTQKKDTRDIFKAEDFWATDYIIKPFSIKKLIDLVDRHVKATDLENKKYDATDRSTRTKAKE